MPDSSARDRAITAITDATAVSEYHAGTVVDALIARPDVLAALGGGVGTATPADPRPAFEPPTDKAIRAAARVEIRKHDWPTLSHRKAVEVGVDYALVARDALASRSPAEPRERQSLPVLNLPEAGPNCGATAGGRCIEPGHPDHPPQHNHLSVGVYGNCPACGTVWDVAAPPLRGDSPPPRELVEPNCPNCGQDAETCSGVSGCCKACAEVGRLSMHGLAYVQPPAPAHPGAARPELTVPRELLDLMHDPTPCWFDHRGGCQAHDFTLDPGEVCPQAQIGALLAGGEPQ